MPILGASEATAGRLPERRLLPRPRSQSSSNARVRPPSLVLLTSPARDDAYEYCERNAARCALHAGWLHEGGLTGSSRVWPGLLLGLRGREGGLGGLILLSANGVAFPALDDVFVEVALDALLATRPQLASVMVGKRVTIDRARSKLLARGFHEICSRRQTLYAATRRTFAPAEPLALKVAEASKLEAIARASGEMAIEEADDDPEGRNPKLFRDRLLERLQRRRDFACFDGETLLYKANIAAMSPLGGHIEGIFVPRALRGRGLGKRGTSTLVSWILEVSSRATLLVNDHNVVARKLYESLGFEVVEESMTLYLVPP